MRTGQGHGQHHGRQSGQATHRPAGTTGGSLTRLGGLALKLFIKSQGIPQKIQILSFSWKTQRHGDTGRTSTSGKDQQAERGAVARVATLLLMPTSQPTPPRLALAPGVTTVPSSEQPRKFTAQGALLTSQPVSQAPSAGQTSRRNQVPVAPSRARSRGQLPLLTETSSATRGVTS